MDWERGMYGANTGCLTSFPGRSRQKLDGGNEAKDTETETRYPEYWARTNPCTAPPPNVYRANAPTNIITATASATGQTTDVSMTSSGMKRGEQSKYRCSDESDARMQHEDFYIIVSNAAIYWEVSLLDLVQRYITMT